VKFAAQAPPAACAAVRHARSHARVRQALTQLWSVARTLVTYACSAMPHAAWHCVSARAGTTARSAPKDTPQIRAAIRVRNENLDFHSDPLLPV